MTDKNILEIAKSSLETGGYTCVLTDGEISFTSTLRGVKPLVRFVDGGGLPRGLYAADKVVGRATAYLYVILGVKALYAAVISRRALSVLEDNGIDVSYGQLVPNIINRSGDGICPFEKAVADACGPDEAYSLILKKMAEMNISLYD